MTKLLAFYVLLFATGVVLSVIGCTVAAWGTLGLLGGGK